MRRIAAHHIYWKKLLPLHVIEIDDEGRLCRVFPLTDEIAGTEFWDGIVYPVPATCKQEVTVNSLDQLKVSGLTEQVEAGSVVILRRLP